jgi:Do/DeqQ family serine protease
MRKVWVVGTMLWLAALPASSGAQSPPRSSAPAAQPPAAPALQTPGGSWLENDGFAAVVARSAPAVVNITATKLVSGAMGGMGGVGGTGGTGGEMSRPRGDEPDDETLIPFLDPFREPFRGERTRPRRARGLGSGVIVSPDGYVLTNNHVVADADTVKVALTDGRELKARVVGTDPATDVAVIKVEGKDLPHLPLGDSQAVRVGQFALAIGDPFGLGQTVTLGVISAVGRGQMGIVDYEDFIQTDAAINPGNSGGALIDGRGQLIGINTALLSSGAAGNQGVGFAVPSNMARQVMTQILKNGRVVRGYLGVIIQDLTPELAPALGLPADARGALVGDVQKNGPAEGAKLQRGDVIVEMNAETVVDSRHLRNRVAQMAPAAKVTLGVLRGGKRQELFATLGELPSSPKPAAAPRPKNVSSDLGLQVAPLTPELRDQLDVPAGGGGVVVTGVAPGSDAADAGLEPGDVIQQIDNRPVTRPDELDAQLRAAKGRPLALLVLHRGATRYVALRAGS